jgi:hypothetical protein
MAQFEYRLIQKYTLGRLNCKHPSTVITQPKTLLKYRFKKYTTPLHFLSKRRNAVKFRRTNLVSVKQIQLNILR